MIYNDDSQKTPSGTQIQEIGAQREKEKAPSNQWVLSVQPVALDIVSRMPAGGFKLAHQGALREANREVERAAVPARGFADRTRAASDTARPALRPVREELAIGVWQWCKLLQIAETRPEAELRPQNLGECRRGAPKGERAPQTKDSPQCGSFVARVALAAGSDALIRSAGADIGSGAYRRSAPLYFSGQLSCSGLA